MAIGSLKSGLRRLLGPKNIHALKMWRKRRFAAAEARTNYAYDQFRFKQASSMTAPVWDQEMLGALIVMDCHRIEKGMALPSPRPGFGRDVVARLIARIPEFESRFGSAMPSIIARQALLEYAEFNARMGEPLPPGLANFNQPVTDSHGDVAAGTVEFEREALQPQPGMDFGKFARSRYSIRHFTGEPVSRELIEQAVSIAQKTPSVCNRQAARVVAALDRETIAAALSWQNGNRGFGDTVGALLIVTADMRIFKDVGERNQAWVDGGLFAMSLCYALHGLKLGSCMLNWSQPKRVDAPMRKALRIPDNEAVITMMAVGHIPPRLRVAASPRRSLDTVLRILEDATPRP